MQFRLIRFCCPPAVVEDVPEEPEVEQEPEEPKEPSDQNTEAKHHPGTSTQNLESALEPVKEPVSAPAPAPAAPPAPGLVMDLQPETGGSQINVGGSGQVNNKKEEEKKEEEDRCAAPEPVREGNICEDQEGMSTQQVQNQKTSGQTLQLLFPQI